MGRNFSYFFSLNKIHPKGADIAIRLSSLSIRTIASVGNWRQSKLKSLESRLLQYERLADDSIAFLIVLLLILNRGKFKLSTSHAFEIRIFDGCYGDDI